MVENATGIVEEFFNFHLRCEMMWNHRGEFLGS